MNLAVRRIARHADRVRLPIVQIDIGETEIVPGGTGREAAGRNRCGAANGTIPAIAHLHRDGLC